MREHCALSGTIICAIFVNFMLANTREEDGSTILLHKVPNFKPSTLAFICPIFEQIVQNFVHAKGCSPRRGQGTIFGAVQRRW